MKNSVLKLGLICLLGLSTTSLQATKMSGPIISHGTPWIETRLSYSMTLEELAEMYYGNSAEVDVIVEKNSDIDKSTLILEKDRIVLIPVTESFTEQAELLGWVEHEVLEK